MSGRGTFTIGNNVDYTYETIDKIEGVKVLSGKNGKHGLPEESHSSTAYIKIKPRDFDSYRASDLKKTLITTLFFCQIFDFYLLYGVV